VGVGVGVALGVGLGVGDGLGVTAACSAPEQPTARRAAATARARGRETGTRPPYVADQRGGSPGGGVSSISSVWGSGVRPARRNHRTARCRRT